MLNHALIKAIGHSFSEPKLLECALSHRSVTGANNERLEFLGDSILNFIIAEALYHKFERAQEGQLSRLRAGLVNRDSLAAIARELDLSPHLKLGSGELKTGGAKRGSILADAVEAIIAAIYLDAGMDACKVQVLRWYQERLSKVNLAAKKDAKTRLQEYLQARKKSLPDYQVVSVTGADHKQTFVVSCQVKHIELLAEGEGSSRRRAEQAAAEQYLNQLIEKKNKI